MYYEARVFSPGALARAVRSFLSTYVSESNPTFNLSQVLADRTTSALTHVDPDDIESLCDLKESYLWGTFRDKADRWIQVSLAGTGTLIHVNASAPDADGLDAIFHHFEGALDLKETACPDRKAEQEKRLTEVEEQLGNLEQRLAGIERSVRQVVPRLRCFLSYRFGDANDLVALRVQRFLALLGVDVVTGDRYEPRSVSQKVQERLSGPLDFLVMLVLANGESFWTRDEITTARAAGIHVIPVVEEGSKFEPGLFGDLEWIPFGPGHVGDAFLKLLEAITFIRTAAERRHQHSNSVT
jgi:hypothetical protein